MIKIILFQAALLLCQTILYFGIQKFEGPAHDVSSSFDKKIPYLPYSIFIYVLWFPMIAVYPLCLYIHSNAIYTIYIISIIADIIISTLIYMIYPSSFTRPEPPDSFIGKIMRLVLRCDYKGKNCMPSMHCSMCFIIMFTAYMSAGFQPLLYTGFALLALMIVISTVFTKQHVIIDVITGFLTAALSFVIGILLKLLLL